MRFKKSNFVLSLLPVAATALPLVLSSPAYAGGLNFGAGGLGGEADDGGMLYSVGIPGDGLTGVDGGNGNGSGVNTGGTGGGGGGAGGGDGGAGGQGTAGSAAAGGAGGIIDTNNGDGEDGADATTMTSGGGGGGGGAAHGAVLTSSTTYGGTTIVFGGTGGDGGDGAFDAGHAGGGGGGGAGGAGVYVTHNDITITNEGSIIGGDGGNGGDSFITATGGQAGQGGDGIYVLGTGVTIINSGTIGGGERGVRGNNGAGNQSEDNQSGVGIYANDTNIINSGIIRPGSGSAIAIAFAGTNNRYEMQAGADLDGDLYSVSSDPVGVFALGGDTDASINLATYSALRTFFGEAEKTGASTWTVTTGGPTTVFGTIKEGTLRFTGPVTQMMMPMNFWVTPDGAGRVTSVEDEINIAGSDLNLFYQPGVYTTREYQLIAIENPDEPGDVIVGTFANVNTTYDRHDGELPDGVKQEIIYNDTEVILSITGGSVAPTNTGGISAPATTTLDNAQFANDLLLGALDTLTGTPDSGDAADNGGYVRMSYVEEVKVAGLMLPPPASMTTSVWGKALGRTTSIDATGGKSGVDAKSGGFMVGADRVVDGALTLGVAAGYSITSFEDDLGSDGTINTVRVAGYGRYTLGAVSIDAALGYAHDFFETDRAVAGLVANSDHGGDEVNAAVAVHVDYDFDGLVLTPKAGLRYTHLWENGYTETGAPGFNLTVARDAADSLQPFVGAKLAKVFHSEGGTKLTPSASIEYAREVLDSAPTSTVSVGGGSFLVKGVEPSRNRLSLGAGLGIAVDKNVSVQVGYKAVVPFDNFFEQTAEISAVWKF